MFCPKCGSRKIEAGPIWAFHCRNCDTEFEVVEQMEQVKCPQCGTLLNHHNLGEPLFCTICGYDESDNLYQSNTIFGGQNVKNPKTIPRWIASVVH